MVEEEPATLANKIRLKRSDTRVERSMKANPAFALHYFSSGARKHYWRREHEATWDIRIILYLFYEEPETKLALIGECFTCCVISTMMIAGSYRTTLLDGNATESNIRVIMIACNSFFTAELLLRMIGLTAPGVSLIRSRRRLLEQLLWMLSDIIAVGAFWVQEVNTGERKVALDLLGSLRVGRIVHAISLWSDGRLILRTMEASAKPLGVTALYMMVGVFFFGSVL